MQTAVDKSSYGRFETKLAEWGTSQAARIPARVMRDTTGFRRGSSLVGEYGMDDKGEYITLRPLGGRPGGIRLGIACDMGLTNPEYDPDEFDALDDEIALMFGECL